MADLYKLQFNNRTILTPSRDSFVAFADSEPPPLPLPSDMDFVYLANDFDGTQIPNRATNSTIGAYLQAGTITKNGSGANCYLSNGINKYNYLYTDVPSDKLEAMKALSTTYTYFIRAYQSTNYSNNCGGLVCFRYNDANDYNYMIRCESGQLQFHGSSGTQTLNLDASKVFRVRILLGRFVNVSDMEGTSKSVSTPISGAMGTRMTSFQVGNPSFSNEYYLDKFYGIAGIARQTTAEEDEQIRTFLLTQGV